MIGDIAFEDFAHERVQRAAGGSDAMKNLRAACFRLKRTVDGANLAGDSAHPIEQLRFVSDGVAHRERFVAPRYTPTRYFLATHSKAGTLAEYANGSQI